MWFDYFLQLMNWYCLVVNFISLKVLFMQEQASFQQSPAGVVQLLIEFSVPNLIAIHPFSHSPISITYHSSFNYHSVYGPEAYQKGAFNPPTPPPTHTHKEFIFFKKTEVNAEVCTFENYAVSALYLSARTSQALCLRSIVTVKKIIIQKVFPLRNHSPKKVLQPLALFLDKKESLLQDVRFSFGGKKLTFILYLIKIGTQLQTQ